MPYIRWYLLKNLKNTLISRTFFSYIRNIDSIENQAVHLTFGKSLTDLRAPAHVFIVGKSEDECESSHHKAGKFTANKIERRIFRLFPFLLADVHPSGWIRTYFANDLRPNDRDFGLLA